MNDRIKATADETVDDLAGIKNDIARLSQQVADAVNALGGIAKGQARRGLRQARANVDSIVSEASDQASAVAAAAQSTAASIEDALSDAILDRPLASIALALGVGFLVGVTWRR